MCQLSISSYKFIYNYKEYSYDEKNRYKNLLTSYEIANLIDSEKDPDGKPLSLHMDDNVKSYFDVHVKQLQNSNNEMKTFTIPELCKSKCSVKNQEETKNDAQQITKENEASEVLA
ncbi:uncharacterized protein LOC107883317 [Acyrthosiphon pisum]|uniref:Uncharacterized protein n=1 Tax=Acyrthosiphon pisum TaxID=7029 RepID=A0A8R2D2Q3_ACYPI|nr:uncharacterized protein LOC107883317 [Acyrthosiphon pisum]|eukprot:XP_016658554.1 PREDICTED: uncharacterized protein LOC107883317 [Acyrthosiphon pisum]